MKCYVIGNGSSLTPALLQSLDAPTFAVNRIWKIFPKVLWYPTYYVRAEVPDYNAEHVKEDLQMMAWTGCTIFLQDGFRGLEPTRNINPTTRFEYFKTCDGSRHDWHLPLICGYGTVVHIAMQIAVNLGFDEIELVACDLGDRHFYNEPFRNSELAKDAHEIAARCCPVPVISRLDAYEKEAYRSG